MSQMTDDSGAAAVSVTQELQDLRYACDRLDIKWDYRHKSKTLLRRIKQAEEEANPVVTLTEPTTSSATANVAIESVSVMGKEGHMVEFTNNSHRPREIPHDVEAALEYMMSYKRANAKLVRSFIESLL